MGRGRGAGVVAGWARGGGSCGPGGQPTHGGRFRTISAAASLPLVPRQPSLRRTARARPSPVPQLVLLAQLVLVRQLLPHLLVRQAVAGAGLVGRGGRR